LSPLLACCVCCCRGGGLCSRVALTRFASLCYIDIVFLKAKSWPVGASLWIPQKSVYWHRYSVNMKHESNREGALLSQSIDCSLPNSKGVNTKFSKLFIVFYVYCWIILSRGKFFQRLYLPPAGILDNKTLVCDGILDGFDVWCLSSKRFISVYCKRIDASNAICKAASVRTFGLSAILWFTDLQLRSYYGDPMSTLDLTRSHDHPNTIRTIPSCPAVLSLQLRKRIDSGWSCRTRLLSE
jgi:hypothetical protein